MPERNVPMPKQDPRWRDFAESLLEKADPHSLSYFDFQRLAEVVATALHITYHEGVHDGASNPYC